MKLILLSSLLLFVSCSSHNESFNHKIQKHHSNFRLNLERHGYTSIIDLGIPRTFFICPSNADISLSRDIIATFKSKRKKYTVCCINPDFCVIK